MRRIVCLSFVTAWLCGAAGCFVTTHPAHEQRTVIVTHDCPPGHYWDGKKCKKEKHEKDEKHEGKWK